MTEALFFITFVSHVGSKTLNRKKPNHHQIIMGLVVTSHVCSWFSVLALKFHMVLFWTTKSSGGVLIKLVCK